MKEYKLFNGDIIVEHPCIDYKRSCSGCLFLGMYMDFCQLAEYGLIPNCEKEDGTKIIFKIKEQAKNNKQK